MSNKKQTSVEYLTKEFSEILGKVTTTPLQDLLLVDAITIAKEKEKQQIIDAYWDGGQDIPLTENRCEQYYNETFKK
jgi:hypothetical protein